MDNVNIKISRLPIKINSNPIEIFVDFEWIIGELNKRCDLPANIKQHLLDMDKEQRLKK